MKTGVTRRRSRTTATRRERSRPRGAERTFAACCSRVCSADKADFTPSYLKVRFGRSQFRLEGRQNNSMAKDIQFFGHKNGACFCLSLCRKAI